MKYGGSRSSRRRDRDRFNSSPRARRTASPSAGGSAAPTMDNLAASAAATRTLRRRISVEKELGRRRRQNGKSLLGALPFFDFDLLDQNAGRDGRDRDPAGFRSAGPVEHGGVIARRQDPRETGQRSADDVHAADQFVGSSVGVDAIDNHGEHLEGLGSPAGSRGEAPGDVLEEVAVRLVLFPAFGHQQFA